MVSETTFHDIKVVAPTVALQAVKMSQASDAKLEEYCLVAKGSKGRTVADVIQRATSDPVLFAFGELLSLASVQQVVSPLVRILKLRRRKLWLILSACFQLADTDQASSFRTLQLFAYGTWATYQGTGRGASASIFLVLDFDVTPSYVEAQDHYLPLSTAQQLKLRQLTLVTMAAASKVDLQLPAHGSACNSCKHLDRFSALSPRMWG